MNLQIDVQVESITDEDDSELKKSNEDALLSYTKARILKAESSLIASSSTQQNTSPFVFLTILGILVGTFLMAHSKLKKGKYLVLFIFRK